MKEYKEVMTHICSKGESYNDMVEYKAIMEELMHKLEKQDPELFKCTMEKLEMLIYKISLDESHKIVSNMRPFGEHWNYDTVKNYVENKGIYSRFVEYYLMMNAMYNDYYDVATNFGHQNDADFYYELANAFINDQDGKKYKVEKYFMD